MVAGIAQTCLRHCCVNAVAWCRRSPGTAPASGPVREVLPMNARYSPRGPGGAFPGRWPLSAERLLSSHAVRAALLGGGETTDPLSVRRRITERMVPLSGPDAGRPTRCRFPGTGSCRWRSRASTAKPSGRRHLRGLSANRPPLPRAAGYASGGGPRAGASPHRANRGTRGRCSDRDGGCGRHG